VTVSNICASARDSVKIDFLLMLKLRKSDSSLCELNMLKLSAQSGYKSYLWQDGSTQSYFIVNDFGEFQLLLLINLIAQAMIKLKFLILVLIN